MVLNSVPSCFGKICLHRSESCPCSSSSFTVIRIWFWGVLHLYFTYCLGLLLIVVRRYIGDSSLGVIDTDVYFLIFFLVRVQTLSLLIDGFLLGVRGSYRGFCTAFVSMLLERLQYAFVVL